MKGYLRSISIICVVVMMVTLTGGIDLYAGENDIDLRVAVKTDKVGNSLYFGGLLEPVAGIYFGASYKNDKVVERVDGSTYNVSKVNDVYPKDSSAFLMHLDFGTPIEEIKADLDMAEVWKKGLVLLWEVDQTYTNMSVFDDYIENTLLNLDRLDSPIFISYGPKMNNKGLSNSSAYVANYQYVAKKLKAFDPNIVLVWTVDDAFTDNIDAYYPGDAYVDWIGISSFIMPGDDAMESIGDVVERYGNYKPVMLTEVGVARYKNKGDVDLSDWAAPELRRLFSVLPIYYPQIKAVFLRNGDYEGDRYHEYNVYGSDKMRQAYNDVVNHAIYTADIGDGGKYRYADLDDRKDAAVSVAGDEMSLFTVFDVDDYEDYTVRYYLDDSKLGNAKNVPYKYDLNIGELSPGSYVLKVKVYDGLTFEAEKDYTISVSDEGAIIETGTFDRLYFDDDDGHWAEPYIKEVSQRGIVVGSNRLYRPDDLMTRAEMTSVLTKLGKLPTGGGVPFTDVPTNRWYHQYVGNASEYLIGYGSKYYPDSYATREEIIAALVKLKAYNVSGITAADRVAFAQKFTDDQEISPQYLDYMILAVKYDIVAGYSDGTLKPKNNMKRGEVAKVLFTSFYQ